ncbi:glucosamine-6-phosphate deaminase [Fervidibacillus halotolerans]|uniref:Glucosamine-6-phosphate deaminase n=1 Tax=Fervidibacillus halotolerans TaxID=2980027 RepID=A0A9E8LYW3_9BACI|nr:glucosamine-6-phosphate deaminase [Fervidibacillus halotolerans]WAA11962.1 glucosamine-6-phosphate deaminase [Fervidibacillus halotolerans]
MKLIQVRDYEEMSKKAADIVISYVKANPNAVLGLATGSTPTGLYKNLIEDHRKNGTSYKSVRTFNLDEYIGLDGNHPQSYRYFMDEHLFNHIDILKENTSVLNGKSENPEKECERYEQMIREAGGIHIQILGIGRNGHIAFNEPGTPFTSRTHIVKLAESTRQANSRFFQSLDEVPTHSITMGIETIMESREILLLASGSSKAEPIRKLFTEPISESFPASILRKHPNVIVIADQEALKDTDPEVIKDYLMKA